MIYPLAGILIGALLGAYRARARGGTGADIAQWAAVFAMILGIAGLFVAVIITRIVT